MARTPARYKVPKSSWVMLWVLILAGIGASTVGAAIVKRVGPFAEKAPPPPPEPAKAATYKALEKDDAVLVTVQVTPRNARLMLDGDPVASNPVRVPRGKTYRVSAVADGYEPNVIEFVADKPKTVRLRLARGR